MSDPRRWLLALFIGGCLLVPARISAQAVPERVRTLLLLADRAERQRDWEKACFAYEEILKDHKTGAVRSRYQHALRRYWQARRHTDLSYRKEVLGLEYGQALRLYGIIRDTLLDHSLEKRRLDVGQLFRKGLDELDAALDDPSFCALHVPNAQPAEVAEFRRLMRRTWGGVRKVSRPEALKMLREVAMTAQSYLQLNPTVTIMEFSCGSCYALDQYTVYLTPNQLRELCHSLKGSVGVGLTLTQMGGRVLIQGVVPTSPAGEVSPPLLVGDTIVTIDNKAVAQLPAAVVNALLEGTNGSTVVLEIATAQGTRTVQLRRRQVTLPTVEWKMLESGVGYLRITSFNEGTVAEVDSAIAQLNQSQARALVLDLRGNGGGLFDAAIDVARRFLNNGIITSTQHQDARLNTVYHARNEATLTLPLTVLVDGDTASAAEVLAGALKENNRARLFGQATFGKGCTQCVLKLPNAAGGLPTGGMRLTVAKFFSPRGAAYSGRGVLPDVVIDPYSPEAQMGAMAGDDLPRDRAVVELKAVLAMNRN